MTVLGPSPPLPSPPLPSHTDSMLPQASPAPSPHVRALWLRVGTMTLSTTT